MTAKEDCFEQASNDYSKEKGDLDLEHKTTWRQNLDGSWMREGRGFWAAVNSMRKWLLGHGHAGSVMQTRVPDVTLGTPKGPLVIDLKFTRANGVVDDWGTKPGAGNGQVQRDDYNQINEQTDPDAKDLRLDPESCNCKVRGAQEEVVLVPMTELEGDLFFVPVPGGFPSPVPGVVPSPVPGGVPVRIPFPQLVPIFP